MNPGDWLSIRAAQRKRDGLERLMYEAFASHSPEQLETASPELPT